MYNKKTHLHFIGIGGIGMSGIATILHHQGYTISGCDQDIHQESVANLQQLGCKIIEGNNQTGCADEGIDIVVYSSAIHSSNPELTRARNRGIPTISRALMLAELMRTKYSIAITGSHGKTTTTSLVSHILLEARFDPTVIIGGNLKNISNNARFGNGDFLVAEADESDRSLLHLHPTLAIVTNIDLEHLETYKDLDDIKNTFEQFLSDLPFYGKAFICVDDANIRSLLPKLHHVKTVTYGLDTPAEFQAINIELNPSSSTFDVVHSGINLGNVTFAMPGKHNVSNAVAAIALALNLGVSFETIRIALTSFKGIARRFSYHGTWNNADVFDDYGHHPEEIRNTLLVAKKRAKNNLIVVFQPHRYIRTERLWNDFITTLGNNNIQHLIMTDIYSAGEAPRSGITTELLVKDFQARFPGSQVTYIPYEPTFDQIKQKLETITQADDLILLLGAGKINTLANYLKNS